MFDNGVRSIFIKTELFLSRCSGLETIDFGPLRRVDHIGDGFLSGCTGLKTIDLSPLCNTRSVGDMFLFECFGIKTLDLGFLRGAKSIGHYFWHIAPVSRRLILNL